MNKNIKKRKRLEISRRFRFFIQTVHSKTEH